MEGMLDLVQITSLEDAIKLGDSISTSEYTQYSGGYRSLCAKGVINALKKRWPQYNWSAGLNREGSRTRPMITPLVNDPREHWERDPLAEAQVEFKELMKENTFSEELVERMLNGRDWDEDDY